jgi:hypothetical protein
MNSLCSQNSDVVITVSITLLADTISPRGIWYPVVSVSMIYIFIINSKLLNNVIIIKSKFYPFRHRRH